MNNDFPITNGAFSVAPTMQQTGTNNVNVTNQEGGTVNFNIAYPYGFSSTNAEMLEAVQSFSTEYYQLIVTCDQEGFDHNMVTVPLERTLLEKSVPAEIYQRCATLSETGIEELKHIPAIICIENKGYRGETDPNQLAKFAYIKKVRVTGRDVQIVFNTIAPFQQQKMCDKRNAVFFDLDMNYVITDLNHTAWTVRKTNLFEAFDEAGIPGLPRPMGRFGQANHE